MQRDLFVAIQAGKPNTTFKVKVSGQTLPRLLECEAGEMCMIYNLTLTDFLWTLKFGKFVLNI